MLFYTNVIQVCVHPLVFDMQRSPGWSQPDWCLHGLWCCLHHHHGTIQVNMMISFSNIMLLCSISNGYVGSICMMSAPQVRQLSLDSSVQHFNIISSDCSIWRRSDCSFFDGGSAWPWPWQRGLPLQLLRHAHLVLQALQQLLEKWHPFFLARSPSSGQAELPIGNLKWASAMEVVYSSLKRNEDEENASKLKSVSEQLVLKCETQHL